MLPQKVSQWLNSLPTFKVLFLLAIALLIQSFLTNLYLNYHSTDGLDSRQYELQFLVLDTIHQQITPMLLKNNLEDIPEILQESLSLSNVHQIAVYQPDGSLIASVIQQESTNSHSLVKVKDIISNNEKIGYLIIDFNKQLAQKVLFTPSQWLYIVATIVWTLFATLLLFNRFSRKSKTGSSVSAEKQASYKHELQQLLKRSKNHPAETKVSCYLIISANWESLKNRPKQPMISLLNRWTAHTGSVMEEFDDTLLKLALTTPVSKSLWQKIQVLQMSFQQLGLESTFLLHSLNFDESIYHHFFTVVDSGIWYESTNEPEEEYEHRPHHSQSIEIEIEEIGIIHLNKIMETTVESQKMLERQSRFYLE